LLHLIRHGVADGVTGRCIGHHDVPLSAEGRAAMRRAGEQWEGPTPTRVISSDLARATASAHELAGAWGLPVEIDPRLRELHFGEWEGCTWEALERDDGARLSAWMQDWVHVAPPGGESFVDLTTRVLACADHLTPGTVVVAHAGSIRALLCHARGVPPERAFDLVVEHARYISIPG
jgi:alpha-ribazole phosphatase